jgi:HTH-type transcriptional regulator / antitoxin HigA
MKLLKTPEQHAEALERIRQLAARGEHLPEPQQDELEVLIALTEKYEKDHQPVSPPTPLEAIKFRMEQMGYKQKDLAALVGGASRASEIMTGKRGLTTGMIRRLRDDWHIPADSLLGSGDPPEPEPSAPAPGADGAFDPKCYPLKQMYGRGYFPKYSDDWKSHRKDGAGLLQDLFRRGSGVRRELAHCRQGGGEKAKINPHALEAWEQRVLVRAAAEKKNLPSYAREALDENFLRWLAGLSVLAEGPRLACEALEEKGIAVIIEPHLDQTHLDGAAMLGTDDRPVIGLTLRHNRLDNFWFTLFHEIGHVLKHLDSANRVILDVDIDRKKTGAIETEADRFALDTLIAPDAWNGQVRHLEYAAEIRAAAKRLCVQPRRDRGQAAPRGERLPAPPHAGGLQTSEAHLRAHRGKLSHEAPPTHQ